MQNDDLNSRYMTPAELAESNLNYGDWPKRLEIGDLLALPDDQNGWVRALVTDVDQNSISVTCLGEGLELRVGSGITERNFSFARTSFFAHHMRLVAKVGGENTP